MPDLRSDSSARDLYRLSKLYEFPHFVKSASLERLRGEGLSPTQFADPLGQRYPCGDAASTWLSALYFEEKRAELDEPTRALVARRLDKMIDFWGIRGAVDQLRKTAEQRRAQAERELADDYYALVWEGEDGSKTRHYRLANAAEVKRAADYLCEHRAKFPYRLRRAMATRILKRAGEERVQLDAPTQLKLSKMAGHGEPDYGKIRVALDKRICRVQGDARKVAQKLGEIIEPSLQLSRDQLGRFVEALDDFDRRNLKPFSLGFPEDEIFSGGGVEQKLANEYCELVTGNQYRTDDFAQLSPEELRDVMGNEFVAEVLDGFEVSPVKVAEIARTLPRGDAQLFERLLSAAGVKPT